MIGGRCIVGKGAYVDKDVRIGDFCKLQNGVFVFHGFNLEAGVFLGPGVMLLNDKHPRAINPTGSPKSDADWVVSEGVDRLRRGGRRRRGRAARRQGRPHGPGRGGGGGHA